jgi:hypothetical protein
MNPHMQVEKHTHKTVPKEKRREEKRRERSSIHY